MSKSINEALDEALQEAESPEETTPAGAEGLEDGAAPAEGSEPVEGQEPLKKTQTKQPDAKGETPDAEPAAEEINPAKGKEQQTKDTFVEYLAADKREKFGKLPPEAQAFVRELHKDLQGGFTKKSQEFAAFEKDVKEVLGQLGQVTQGKFKSMGELTTYISSMQNFESELKQNPQRTLLVLMNSLGITLEQLAQYQPNAAEEAMRPIRQEILKLQNLVGKQGAVRQSSDAPANDTTDPKNVIETFRNARDNKGNVLHPHFDKVARVIGSIIEGNTYEDLEKAYNQAIQVLPEVREAAEKAAAAKAQREQADVAKAKRAAKVNIHSSAVPGEKKGRPSLNDILKEELENFTV